MDDLFVLAENHALKPLFAASPVVVRRLSEIEDAVFRSTKSSIWIAGEPFKLLRSVVHHASSRARHLGIVIAVDPVPPALTPALHATFDRALGGTAGFRVLPMEELAEVLSAPNAGELVLGGVADAGSRTITLVRGNGEVNVLPFEIFRPGRVRPDFDDFEVADHGSSIRLGQYEAAVGAILYEVDADFRRELKRRRRRDAEKTFGAALRRLRLLRGLRQDEFGALNAKTISRIERGEVARPHQGTLQILARRLGVRPTEIEDY